MVIGGVGVGVAAGLAAVLLGFVGGEPWPHAAEESVAHNPGSTNMPPPTATPTPTPAPPSPVPSRCYEPRPAATEFTLFPASPRSIFQNCQVIAYYGYPGNTGLGVLGELAVPDQLGQQLTALADTYDAVNGSRSAVGGLHLIAAVAQDGPGPDGSHLYRMPGELIEQYIAVAEQYDFVVFLDLQIGTSDVVQEVERVLPYLRHPRVHLALDPEWTMAPGVTPGTMIGSMDGSAIDAAQRMLQQVVDETQVPSKILVVHQFTESMITNKSLIQDMPGVDFVIDMDGFGGREVKLNHYQLYVADGGAEHGGIKLFIDEDVDIFQPAEVEQIVPQPDYVQYQ